MRGCGMAGTSYGKPILVPDLVYGHGKEANSAAYGNLLVLEGRFSMWEASFIQWKPNLACRKLTGQIADQAWSVV